jgi:hypothetical protein
MLTEEILLAPRRLRTAAQGLNLRYKRHCELFWSRSSSYGSFCYTGLRIFAY